MDESAEKGNGSEGAKSPPAAPDPLGELRRLLFVAEEAQVSRIQERLDDPEIHAEDVSRVLPEAMVLRAAKDDALTQVLQPTVEEAIVTSVRRNPQVLVDALFPVMGPAIRKAISSALASMVESFSETLEHSFSVQGVRWRIEAWRTGKPLAEVILLRTLVYRVEQVFLIHRESGLLLQHVSATAAGVQDADMVSGMLTAIRDFVHDSFGGKEGDSLDTFQVGERSVWIEQGPHATLAAVIRGTAPRELRTVLTEAIELIHLEQADALQKFAGDATPFERSRPILEACLKAQRQQKAERVPGERRRRAVRVLRAALGVLVVGLALWAFFAARRNRRWEAYLGRLASEPGVVVTAEGRSGGKYFVAGLRDPLAADPVAMLDGSGFSRGDVESDWKPYQALTPELIAARARYLLEAPDTVKLAARDGALVAFVELAAAAVALVADREQQGTAEVVLRVRVLLHVLRQLLHRLAVAGDRVRLVDAVVGPVVVHELLPAGRRRRRPRHECDQDGKEDREEGQALEHAGVRARPDRTSVPCRGEPGVIPK